MSYSYEAQRITGGIGADDEFWRALERNAFLLPACDGCGAWTWPAHFRCGKCGGWTFSWRPRPLRGVIFTWTRSHYAFDRVRERAADIPYVTAVVEIEDAGGARVIGAFEGPEDGLRVGAAVQGRILPPSEKTKGYASVCWSLAPERAS